MNATLITPETLALALSLCNSCDAEPADSASPAGYCASCQAAADAAPRIHDTRESWLQAAINGTFRPMLAEVGVECPPVLISMGYGPGMKAGGTTLAACFVSEISGGVNTIFVIPETADLVDILDSVLHELIHAADNGESGHTGFFARTAKAVGFEAPYTATPLSKGLRSTLRRLAHELGDFGGHRKFDIVRQATILLATGATIGTKGPTLIRPTGHGGKQSNRHMKAECLTDGCDAAADGYKVRLSRRQAEAHGAPKCPACDQPMTFESAEGGDS